MISQEGQGQSHCSNNRCNSLWCHQIFIMASHTWILFRCQSQHFKKVLMHWYAQLKICTICNSNSKFNDQKFNTNRKKASRIIQGCDQPCCVVIPNHTNYLIINLMLQPTVDKTLILYSCVYVHASWTTVCIYKYSLLLQGYSSIYKPFCLLNKYNFECR